MQPSTLVTTTLASAALLALIACGAAKPVYYQGDDTRWEVELIDPERPELVVEATVHGAGPYLFILDPDAPRSVMDDQVARDLDLYSDHRYVRVVNQNDVSVPRKFYEVLALDVGELHVRNVKVLNAPAGSLRVGERQVHGILGADLLSRTIVVGIDRDRGTVSLALTGHATVPANAAHVDGWLHYGSLYVPMRVGGRTLTMQVRLSSAVSTLRSEILRELGRAGAPGSVAIVDETGTALRLEGGGVLDVALDSVLTESVRFYRHGDQRERFDLTYDGVLGQDILSRYHVVVDRDRKTLHLAPRTTTAASL